MTSNGQVVQFTSTCTIGEYVELKTTQRNVAMYGTEFETLLESI